ncbi:MAG: DUF92 domain-containing protein [Gemmatimonadetes bacterium]|nr:DUF92 domain-containing protein [Gemmatimonadota bacterium]
MMERVLLGAFAAVAITVIARRYEVLDESGQWGALAIGILASAAGWPWAGTLVIYFVAAAAITWYGAPTKAARTESSTSPVRTRHLLQVLANGIVFVAFAYRARGNPQSIWGIGAAGALAASFADTAATEIGTLYGRSPRSILTWQRVSPGLSGGVTLAGTAAAVVGAAFVAAIAAAMHGIGLGSRFVAVVTIGGVAGCLADSLLGATVQARRWCEHCNAWTERRVHPCSYRTVHARGIRWVDNSVVNLAATAIGAVAAVAAVGANLALR